MVAGRPKKSEQSVLEGKIRTIAWFKSVITISKSKNANDFSEKFFGEVQRKWNNYSKGLNTPSVTTLNIIENEFPETGKVFDNGPEDSNLFEAMFSDVDDILIEIENQNTYIWLSSIILEFELLQMSNEEIIEVIKHLDNILTHNKVFETDYLSDHPETHLEFLSGCIIILRYCIERDRYISHSYVDDILNLTFKILIISEIKNTLDTYKIYELFLEWLLSIITNWCNYSKCAEGFVIGVNSIPTLDEFKNNPEVFLKELLNCYLIYSKDYVGGQDYIHECQQLVRNKQKKWGLLE